MTAGRQAVAYSFLILAIHEAHELAHVTVGRVVCGEWAARGFNTWRFAGECPSSWPTAAGPLFSYLLMLAGAVVVRRQSVLGPALILAANPFARIFTAAMGGGDEMVVAQRLSGAATRTLSLRLAVLLFVLAVCGSAIAAAWRSMRSMALPRTWFFVALLWPMVLTGVALFVVGERLLRAGLLAAPVIAGAPLLVHVVSVAAVLMTAVTLKWRTGPSW